MALNTQEPAKWLSIVVRLSRKAYYPGAVVSGVITVEPATEPATDRDEGEYVSFISAQLHGHIGIVPNLASFPKELKRGKQKSNPIAYGNVNKFVNDTTDCLYQTSSVIIDSDIVIRSLKAYFFQITLPKEIPPSLKTNCVRYLQEIGIALHLNSPQRASISSLLLLPFLHPTPSSYRLEEEYTFPVAPSPIKSPSFSSDITQDYTKHASFTVAEEEKPAASSLSDAVPLEFDGLRRIDVSQTAEDARWAQARFITSYAEFLSANPLQAGPNCEESLAQRPKSQIGIFTVTHGGESICSIQLTTDPVIHGDVVQMIADFTDTQIPCEQMTVSLLYEEYAPHLRGKIIRSDLVSTQSVMTRHVLKYPCSFSIPAVYPPTLQTEQVKIGWKLQFSFLFPKKRETAGEEYVFDPEAFLSQSMTKVDWCFDVKVKGCVNERFNDALGEECEMNGREYSFLV